MIRKRLAVLWLRNMSIAIGAVLALFLFGFLLFLLNSYFGTPLLSLLLIGIIMLVWGGVMCYKMAEEQLVREDLRSKQIMDTLRKP